MTFSKAFKRGLIIGSLGLAATAFAGVSPFTTQNVSGCWNAVADGVVGTGNGLQMRHTVIAGITLDDGAVSGGEVVQELVLPNQTALGGNQACYFTGGAGTYSVDGSGMMTITDTFTPNATQPDGKPQLPGCLTSQTPFTASIAIDSFKHGRGTYHNQIKANGQSDQGGTVEIYKQVEAE